MLDLKITVSDHLFISAVYTTKSDKLVTRKVSRPSEVPMFCMLLRLLFIFRLSSDNFYPDFGRLDIVIMEKPRITKKLFICRYPAKRQNYEIKLH